MELMFLADLLEAYVLVEVKIEKIPYSAPVVADIFLPLLLPVIKILRLAQNERPFPIPLIAGRRYPAVEPSGFLFRFNAALHARNDLFLFLGRNDSQKGRDKPLVVVGEIDYV